MRRAHFLTQPKSCEMPHSVIYTDTETKQRAIAKGAVRHELWFGWACFERTRRAGEWCEPEWFRYETPDDFWSWATHRARAHTKTYMFAHNWAFDAPVVQTFTQMPNRGWTLQRAVIDSPPVVLSWSKETTRIEMLDTLNWWRVPLAKIGDSLRLDKLPYPGRGASRDQWDTYCRRDVEVIRAVLRAWWSFLAREDLGSFSRTLASQAFRAYRHRFMDFPILIDSDQRALSLARDSYHGGRTECFQIGKVKGPIYAFDVNSAYPATMATHEYPAQHVRSLAHVRVSDLRRWLADYAVIARVKLQTKRRRYAHLHRGKLIFPVGIFWAALSTEDLAEAIDAGEVQACDEAALYEKAPIFARFVSELYALRLAAASRGDAVQTWLLKILMNSLYGKFGQRGRAWDVIGPAPDQSVKVWCEYDVVEGVYRELRQLGGVIQAMVDEGEAFDSSPAIAAHVTAQARAMLWRYIQIAGESEVIYVDTDSLYVTEAGAARLRPHEHPTDLGKLKQEGVYPWVSIRGAKDYETPKFKRIKGVSGKALWLDENTVQQEQWSSLVGLVRAGSLDAPITKTITKRLSRIYDKGTVGRDGRVLPIRLSEPDRPGTNDR